MALEFTDANFQAEAL